MDSVDNNVLYRSKASVFSFMVMLVKSRKKKLQDADVSVPWGTNLHLSPIPPTMTDHSTDNYTDNYTVFRECLSNAIVARSEKPKVKRKKAKRNESNLTEAPERADPEELAEFVDVHFSTSKS